MKKLVRIDENDLLIDLDQKAIARTAKVLIEAIDAEQPSCTIDMKQLRDYAELGVNGGVTKTRNWSDEPLRWEWREYMLPDSVMTAYGKFTFYTHGLTYDVPEIVMKDGVAHTWVEVDD